jgi:hypothetical protein
MATFRQIHNHIWKDSWFFELSVPRKLLFIYLFSNDRAHTSGVYEIPLQVLLFESGLEPEEAREALAYFQESGRVYFDQDTGHLFVRNMMRYNGSNVLTNQKVRTNLYNYRQAEGASLAYWDLWQDAYPQVADKLFATSQKEQKEEQRQKEQAASLAGGASSVGVQEAASLLELARQEPANDLDRQRLEALALSAETHRLSLPKGQPGAELAGTDWLREAIEVANAARKPRVPLTLAFIESILKRWMADGFRAGWGHQDLEFEEAKTWGAS